MLDLSTLEQALNQFELVLARANDPLVISKQDQVDQWITKAGIIQHFEIVYELCWKFMQRWIKENRNADEAEAGRSRKDLYRVAARLGLIKDPEHWFDYGDARNLSTHTYSSITADRVYAATGPLAKDARYFFIELKKRND